MTISLATQNPGKIAEIRALLPKHWTISSANDLGITEEIPETGNTLEANAEQKARYIFEHCGLPTLADDTGLEIDALNGAPGVYSARYAGEEKDNEKNMAKVLDALEGITNRNARFRTVLAWATSSGIRCFEGIVEGQIAHSRHDGEYGFGYDPIFIPQGHTCSFAQMPAEEKSSISHRGRALKSFGEFIRAESYGEE